MKKILICILLALSVVIPFVFVGCGNSNNNSNTSTPSTPPKVDVSREFRFEALNDFNNIDYQFDKNKITVKLNENSSQNVVNFSVKIFNNNKLEDKQSIIYSISNKDDIEIVNCKFANVYLKFNKTGTYTLKLTDEFELLKQSLTIIVE